MSEIVIVPLEQDYDRLDVYGYTGNSTEIAARGFLRANDITPEETVRYTPEWDDSLGGDAAGGGFRIDLDQEGEVVNIGLSDDTSADSDDDETASAD